MVSGTVDNQAQSVDAEADAYILLLAWVIELLREAKCT